MEEWGDGKAEKYSILIQVHDLLHARIVGLDSKNPPTPDNILGHVKLAQQIAPIKIAAGEHLPNKVLFKNFLQADAMHYVLADCTRLADVSEFISISLLAKKFGLPVVPHVGNMGQLHQHLVLFSRVALNHEALFLEHIPHLREHFVFPAQVKA